MRFSTLLPLFIACAAAPFVMSCSDDNEPPVVNDQDVANVREADATYNSLTFTWDKVEGVNQYGYTLSDANGNAVADDVTDLNSVTFDDLATDAEYSFQLRVYGAAGDPSYYTTIKATTLPIQQLPTPDVKGEQQGNLVKLTWEPLKGAGTYEVGYTIGGVAFTTETDEPCCLVPGLAPGEHTLTVTALPANDGYTPSNVASVTVTRSRKEIGTVTGTYTSGLLRRNNTWEATMHIFDDNSYVIDSFYKYDKNLDFFVVADGDVNYIGLYSFAEIVEPFNYLVDTGFESVSQIQITTGITSGGAFLSAFEGNATSGSVSFNTVYSTAQGTDTFVW